MGRSVLFFTFVLAMCGCGSDPETASDPDVDRNPTQPFVETIVRPPPGPGIERVTSVDDARSSATDPTTPARRLSHHAAIEAPHPAYCPSPSLCTEASHH